MHAEEREHVAGKPQIHSVQVLMHQCIEQHSCSDIPCSLAVQVPENSQVFQLVVRGVLERTLGIPTAASDVIGAQWPLRIWPVTEAGGCWGEL